MLTEWISQNKLFLPLKRNKFSKINIDLCFPELSKKERYQIYKKNVISFGDVVFSTGIAWFWSDKKIQSKVDYEVIGIDHLSKNNPNKGNLIILPKGANAVDFSYAVHSEVGNAAVGVKINNKNRLITTEIKNGDQVEILTSKNGFPDPKWIETCITGKAKSAIRRFIRNREIKEFLQLGTALLQKEYRQQNKRMHEKSLIKVINEFDLSDVEELLIEIGKGNINSREVLNFLYPN